MANCAERPVRVLLPTRAMQSAVIPFWAGEGHVDYAFGIPRMAVT
jgi:hypothetical protein